MIIIEENFIEELKNGNEEALNYVIDNYAWILKTVINKHLFYLEDYKEECMNDCLLAIWNNIESYDSEKAEFKNWVGGIAKYKSIDYIRKYLKDIELKNIDDENIVDDKDNLDFILEKEFNDQVNSLLSNLSKRDREIFIQTYFKDRTANQISNEMNIKESNIYNRLSRGRRKLKALIGGKKNE